ncbi:MAG: response regulator, partial [Bacteroidetes bacterium]
HSTGKKLPTVLMSPLGELNQSDILNKYRAVLLYKPIKIQPLADSLLACLKERPQAAERQAPKKGTTSDFSDLASQYPLRLLVTEDNLINQKLVLRMLSKLGYKAKVANNGLEALQALRNEPFDLILMDVQMPEMDGLEATRNIVKEWGEQRPFIVAMTANAMQGDREMCLEAGMDDYISKPFQLETLREMLAKYAKKLSSGEVQASE